MRYNRARSHGTSNNFKTKTSNIVRGSGVFLDVSFMEERGASHHYSPCAKRKWLYMLRITKHEVYDGYSNAKCRWVRDRGIAVESSIPN